MEILIGIGIFILTVFIIEGLYFVFRTIRRPEKKLIQRRLRTLSSGGYETDESIGILRRRMLSEVPWLNQLLLRFQWTDKMHRLLEQANTRHTLGVFVLLSILLAFIGFIASSWLTLNYLIKIPVTIILGLIPFFYIYLKKKQRMEKFQKQLPEALDLVARGLKAGHAFSGGLKLVAEEMGDPIGTEFEKTLDQTNFGVGIAEALKALSNRVDCPDLKFFVIAVILQRETGGNLAEILENISYLIRERFKLHGRVRALSAEGRLSATILIILPFFIAFVISIINPNYLRILITDPIGNILIFVAMAMMIVGFLIMKRMIDIKV